MGRPFDSAGVSVTDVEGWQRALVAHGKMHARLKVLAEGLHRSQKYAAIVFPADLQQAWAEMAELLAERVRLYARGPQGKTKSGRPGIWKSVEGLCLIAAVEEIRANKHCGLAHAIRLAIKDDPALKNNKAICRLKDRDRALQARYQEAVKHWSFLRGSFEEMAAWNVQMLAAIEHFTTTFERWKASWPAKPD